MSSMMVFSPAIMSAVARVSSAVSSCPRVSGTGDFRSPSTSCFIRWQQARMGTLMLLASFTATTMEARAATTLTKMLIRMLT
jgi:hypothetical protein